MLEVADFWKGSLFSRKHFIVNYIYLSITLSITLIWWPLLKHAASNLLTWTLILLENQFIYPACHSHPVISSSCVLKQPARGTAMNCCCYHSGCTSMAHRTEIQPCGSENWTLCSLCEILDPNLDITQCKLTQGSYKFSWNLYSKIFNLVWITQLRSGLYKSAYNTCTKILTMFYVSAQQPM